MQNKTGDTALMLAISARYAPVVEILLNAKAQVNIQNKTGDTAYVCSRQQQPRYFRLLLASWKAN